MNVVLGSMIYIYINYIRERVEEGLSHLHFCFSYLVWKSRSCCL
uniref:Uncharacterized protein n=1 Tax=Anguilla anguilla TaxID=7936 RepID=A0A0E9RWY2_ANGAN